MATLFKHHDKCVISFSETLQRLTQISEVPWSDQKLEKKIFFCLCVWEYWLKRWGMSSKNLIEILIPHSYIFVSSKVFCYVGTTKNMSDKRITEVKSQKVIFNWPWRSLKSWVSRVQNILGSDISNNGRTFGCYTPPLRIFNRIFDTPTRPLRTSFFLWFGFKTIFYKKKIPKEWYFKIAYYLSIKSDHIAIKSFQYFQHKILVKMLSLKDCQVHWRQTWKPWWSEHCRFPRKYSKIEVTKC